MFGPGTRLGIYEITATLGAGGMGEVYRARDTRLKRDVALKILPDTFASDPDRLARFQREAEVLASLNHPNIAAIYGLEESGAVRALVLEMVEGETLADRIARGAIPVEEALPIARQIAEALEAAHEQGIIHRDLKPANIKLRPDGSVKVLDFGLAKLATPDMGRVQPGRPAARGGPADLTNSSTMTPPALTTGVGVLLGTAAYMSPEQARGGVADKRSDMPDGTRIAVDVRTDENDVWIWDIPRRTMSRLTFDSAVDSNPIWTPDGRRVLFWSAREGRPGVWSQAADGGGTPQRVTTGSFAQFPKGISPDGRWAILADLNPANRGDLYRVDLNGSAAPAPLFSTPAVENSGAISPDGRWIAYSSDESGASNIYVHPFPDVRQGRWQVSSPGAMQPVWGRDGRELFFLQGTALPVVPIETEPTFQWGTATGLFDASSFTAPGWRYDVSPDGKRFVFAKGFNRGPDGVRSDVVPSAKIIVVQNWFERLKPVLPVN